MTPVTFGGCFGWLHAGERARGVVLCGPLGNEGAVAHRAWRWLALRLAEAGLAVLRYDLPGTGDSAGDETDPGRLDAWLASLGEAARFLRRQAGVREIALVGLRFGALLAGLSGISAERLVLLAPPASGRAYLREMTALSRLALPSVGAPADPPEWRADLEVGGFVLTAETRAAIARLDFAGPIGPPAGRILLLPRDGQAGELAARLRRWGATVDLAPFIGYDALFAAAPHSAQTPEQTFALVVRWLAEGAPPCRSGGTQPAQARLVLPEGVETPLMFGPGRRLFGIHCRPAVPAQRPPMIFLNTGANHHIGANRLTVILCRALAAQGIPSLRFDLAGLGDSVDSSIPPARLLYSLESGADVRAALDLMQSRGHGRALLFGLCAGAYQAFHSALADDRVCGLVMVNLQTFHWRETDSLDSPHRTGTRSAQFYLSPVVLKEALPRLLRGQVRPLRVLRVLAARLGQGLAIRRSSGKDDVLARFRRLAERGVGISLIYSLEDNGLPVLECHLGSRARRMRGHDDFRLNVIEGADHTLTRRWSRRLVSRLVVDFALGRLAGAEGGQAGDQTAEPSGAGAARSRASR